MSKKIKLLLFILCFVAAALNGCAKNADSEVQGSDTAVAITNPRQIVAADNKTGPHDYVGSKGEAALYAGVSLAGKQGYKGSAGNGQQLYGQGQLYSIHCAS